MSLVPFAAAFALSLMQPAASSAPAPAAPETPEAIVTLLVNGFATGLPREVAPGIRMMAARAEGAMMVLTFRVAPDAEATSDPVGASDQFFVGFCADPVGPALFARGVRIRVDTQRGEGPMGQGPVVDRCANDPAGLPAAGG